MQNCLKKFTDDHILSKQQVQNDLKLTVLNLKMCFWTKIQPFILLFQVFTVKHVALDTMKGVLVIFFPKIASWDWKGKAWYPNFLLHKIGAMLMKSAHSLTDHGS